MGLHDLIDRHTTGFSGGGEVVGLVIAGAAGIAGLTIGGFFGYRAGKRAALAPSVPRIGSGGPMPGSYAAIQAEAQRAWR